MEYGFGTGQPTATKAVFCLIDLDLSIAPAGERLEMDEDRVVIGSSEELYLHRIMYILGETCVHFSSTWAQSGFYSNHRIIS